MTAETKQKRRSRYQAGGATGLRLTKRDIMIVRLVARYYFLGRDQIGHLLALHGFTAGGMDKKKNLWDPAKLVQDRLTELFHLQLLDRPQAAFVLDFPGSSKMNYSLGRAGVGLLREVDGENAVGLGFARKAAIAKRSNIEHALATNQFEIGLRQAVEQRHDLGLVVGDDLMSEDVLAELKRPWHFSVSAMIANEQRDVGIIPDLGLTLGVGDKRLGFFAEICRGTEPVVRYRRDTSGRKVKRDQDREPTLGSTSLLRKFLAYSALKRSGGVERRLGWRNFKVLFVCESRTPGERRVALMQKAVAQFVPDNRGMFLFADRSALEAHGDTLNFNWVNWNNEPQRIDPVWVSQQLQKT